MANHFNILALRIPWTVCKGKKIGHWKMNCPGVGTQYATGDQWRNKPRKTEIWQVCRGGFQSIQNLVALREEILNSNRCQDESCFCFPHYLKCCSGSSWKKKQKQIFDEMTVLSHAYIRQFLWKGLKCFGQNVSKCLFFDKANTSVHV